MLNDQIAVSVLQAYGLCFKRMRPDLPLDGSPERSLERIAVQDERGGVFLLEAHKPEAVKKKQAIAAALESLSRAGLKSLAPYFSCKPGRHILSLEGAHYQLSPYIEGTPLPRPQYLDEAWRGRAMAGFLVQLRSAWTKAGLEEKPTENFTIEDFVPDLVQKISARDPQLLGRLAPALALAEDFLPVLKDSPLGFCHGDFHPMNIIWGENSVRAVIDWEFCGLRPEMYDAALMVGCAGLSIPRPCPGITPAPF